MTRRLAGLHTRRLTAVPAAACAALAACDGPGATDPGRPLLTVTPNPLVMLSETQQRLALVTREQRSLRNLSFWVDPSSWNPLGPAPVGVDSVGVVAAGYPGRATVAIAVEADGVDTNAYVPVVVRGLRRPDFFGGPADTLHLWLGVSEHAGEFLKNPAAEDTVPVAQGVRWSSSDTAVFTAAPARRDYDGEGVQLTPRRPGRATLTVQSTAVPAFVLRRAVAVGYCRQWGKFGCVRGDTLP